LIVRWAGYSRLVLLQLKSEFIERRESLITGRGQVAELQNPEKTGRKVPKSQDFTDGGCGRRERNGREKKKNKIEKIFSPGGEGRDAN